jgi:hypothetical protein
MVKDSKIKLMICGSRSITDSEWVKDKIEEYWYNNLAWVDHLILIEGEAKGVDSIAKEYAQENDWEIESYPADWENLGKSAGFIRNIEMVKECDQCLIFWDGVSKGTKHDIDLCKKYNKPFKVIYKE